ncbi:MAG: alpha/beta hydrolase family protein [Armatimonadota bacterium]
MSDRLIFESDRDDGRFQDIEGFMNTYLRNLEPALQFDPDMTAEEQEKWRTQVQSKLRELLAFPPESPDQPEPQMLWAEQRDGYELQKWEIYPEPYSVVPFLALIPDHISAHDPGPAVMCFPGSSSSKELLAGEPEEVPWANINKHPVRNRMAKFYAQAGITAIAVDHPDRGERTRNCFGDSRYEWTIHAIWVGRSFEGQSVFEKMKILQWLRERDYVDDTRIATSGHSLGALPALHMGVIEPSLAAVVWNDWAGCWRDREVHVTDFRPHIGHYIPGMQQWFDYIDLMAAVAPRPFLITEGGRTRDIETIARAWDTEDASDNFTVHYYPKFSDPESRVHDDEEYFEGMTLQEHLEYCNVDVPAHCFKENIAVPWLAEKFGVTEGG